MTRLAHAKLKPEMKILAFSDTHPTYKFDKRRYGLLAKVISKVGMVIIKRSSG